MAARLLALIPIFVAVLRAQVAQLTQSQHTVDRGFLAADPYGEILYEDNLYVNCRIVEGPGRNSIRMASRKIPTAAK